MKKILIAMVLFALMALPMSAMALTTISDSDLSTVTGQAGVSIGADITMNLSFGTVAWGDIDGLAGTGAGRDVDAAEGGWVGISDLAINNLRIHMRTDAGMIDATKARELAGLYLTGGDTWGSDAAFYTDLLDGTPGVPVQAAALMSILATEQFLTIDIYTDTTLATDKTYVRIGLPTFEITMDDLTLNVGLWTNVVDANGDSSPGVYQSLGQVYMAGIQVLVDKNNFVDISQNDTDSGVLIHIGNAGNTSNGDGTFTGTLENLAHVNFDVLSWGDLDGLTTTDHAGFVGIKGLSLAVGMDMLVNINVATATTTNFDALVTEINGYTTNAEWVTKYGQLTADLAANDPEVKDMVAWVLHTQETISATSVDIALAGTVSVGQMAMQILLADTKELDGTFDGAVGSKAGILGNVYLGGIKVEILGTAGTQAGMTAPQSWVSISAH